VYNKIGSEKKYLPIHTKKSDKKMKRIEKGLDKKQNAGSHDSINNMKYNQDNLLLSRSSWSRY
jgi:hypothetical protein